jgi:excisionase family DNA binding protein
MLTKKEVAEKLGVSEKTIQRWMKERLIPYSKLNGIVRFDEKKIDMWVERRTVRLKTAI